jgi:hypothetical protein
LETFTHHALPMYSHDHAVYIRQMHEWHMKTVQYHEQLKVYHSEKAKQFQDLMGVTTRR